MIWQNNFVLSTYIYFILSCFETK